MDCYIAGRIVHGSQSLIQYGFDWTDMLKDGETIASATWSVDDNSLTIGDGAANGPAPSVTTQVVQGKLRHLTNVWLGSGEAGRTYQLNCAIETAPSGELDDETVEVAVVER